VYAVVEGQTPRFLFELEDLTFHDFLVEINGTSSVKFYHKAPSDADWASCGTTCEFDENLPDGPMRFSAAIITNPGGSLGHIRMKVFEFAWER
jgi:hypothetical protein